MNPARKTILLAVLLAAAGPGCVQELAPPANVGYYLQSEDDVLAINRVAFVELSYEANHKPMAEAMTDALFRSIQGRKLWQIDTIPQTDPVCTDLTLDYQHAYTMQELDEMRRKLGTDAVLFGAIRDYAPYPRMQIGLQLRMLDLKNGQLIWGIDHTWDTTDYATERRMEVFFDDRMRRGFEPVEWQLALMSPSTFMKFIAHETTDTLPWRHPELAPQEDVHAKATRRTLRKAGKTLGRL